MAQLLVNCLCATKITQMLRNISLIQHFIRSIIPLLLVYLMRNEVKQKKLPFKVERRNHSIHAGIGRNIPLFLSET